jgi:hypothetical protein
MSLTTGDFHDILTQSFADLTTVKTEVIQTVIAKYAPRLAMLGQSDDPQGERDDIVTNARLELAIFGIQTEEILGRAIQVAANVALKLALA